MSVWNLFFSAVDSWLFKPALAPDGLGARLLASDFPPPKTTLVGALRSAVGEQLGAHWPVYRKGEQPEVEQAIGAADEPHPPQAQVAGPWLSCNGEKLVPLPLCFLAKARPDGALEVAALQLSGDTFNTDLGQVHLPALPETLAGQGFKGRTDIWVVESVLNTIATALQQQEVYVLAPDSFMSVSDLFVRDERLGISMTRTRRTVQEGMLYQVQHVRLREDLSLMLQVSDWPEVESAHDTLVTLGADGRLAHLTVQRAETPWMRQVTESGVVVVTAPVEMHSRGLSAQLPEDRLISAATGKPWRRGGWQMKQHRSKPVRLWVAPGSVYWIAKGQPLHLNPDYLYFEQAGLEELS